MATKSRKELLRDASAAGYSIGPHHGCAIYISKKVGRWKKPRGLVLYDDGTAFVLDVECDAATTIRSYKDMRKALSI